MAAGGISGVEYLRTRKEIDPKQIGVWGVSQGSWLGPLADDVPPHPLRGRGLLLRRQPGSPDVPSKLMVFQDTNHWVTKPADSILWYRSVLDWLDHWVKPERDTWLAMRRNEAPR